MSQVFIPFLNVHTWKWCVNPASIGQKEKNRASVWTVSPQKHSWCCTRLYTGKVTEIVVWGMKKERSWDRSSDCLFSHSCTPGQSSHEVDMLAGFLVSKRSRWTGFQTVWRCNTHFIWSTLMRLPTESLTQRVCFPLRTRKAESNIWIQWIFCIYNTYHCNPAVGLHTDNKKYRDPGVSQQFLKNTLWQPKHFSRLVGKFNWQ